MLRNTNTEQLVSDIQDHGLRLVGTSTDSEWNHTYMSVHTCILVAKRSTASLDVISMFLTNFGFVAQPSTAKVNVRPLFFSNEDGSSAVVYASQGGEVVSVTVQWMAD